MKAMTVGFDPQNYCCGIGYDKEGRLTEVGPYGQRYREGRKYRAIEHLNSLVTRRLDMLKKQGGTETEIKARIKEDRKINEWNASIKTINPGYAA